MQKGVDLDDIVVLVADDYRYMTMSVGIPGCEQHTASKEYSGKDDYLLNSDKDIRDYQKSLARTVFAVEDAPVDELAVQNDSWGAIWKDAKAEIKTKLLSWR